MHPTQGLNSIGKKTRPERMLDVVFFFCTVPVLLASPLFHLLPPYVVATQIRGHISTPPPPPSRHNGTRVAFYREKGSAFFSLVESHRGSSYCSWCHTVELGVKPYGESNPRHLLVRYSYYSSI